MGEYGRCVTGRVAVIPPSPSRGTFEGQGFAPLCVCARAKRITREGEGERERVVVAGVEVLVDGEVTAKGCVRGWLGVCARGGESPVPSIYSACEPVDSG